MDPGGGVDGGSSEERNLDFYIINSSYTRTGEIGSFPHSYKLSRTTLGLIGSTRVTCWTSVIQMFRSVLSGQERLERQRGQGGGMRRNLVKNRHPYITMIITYYEGLIRYSQCIHFL